MAELVVALDFENAVQALGCASKLQGVAPWMKVGLELYVSEGPQMIQALKRMGFKVFLDLKFYDIPNTVKGAVQSAVNSGADMLTLHLSGGERMCRAAAEVASAAAHRPILLGVTVLTSFSEGEVPGYAGSLGDLARMLAGGAAAWGLDGVVCSGHEVAAIKAQFPSLKGLTPGIRLPDNDAGDQRRIMTPAMAVAAGSDFLVVGRPITRAMNPAEAAAAVLENMKQGSER